MAQQHDRHQRGQLPPKCISGIPERHGQTEEERHADREGDQRHHAGKAIAQLASGSFDEYPAAVKEHRRAEDCRDVSGPWE
jgi:hypothetical protein